jgi:hypothetical protein
MFSFEKSLVEVSAKESLMSSEKNVLLLARAISSVTGIEITAKGFNAIKTGVDLESDHLKKVSKFEMGIGISFVIFNQKNSLKFFEN